MSPAGDERRTHHRFARARRLITTMAKVVAIVLGSVAILYLVGMNVFLRTRLFRDAIGVDPNSLLVEYAGAYSLWPGRIHADSLSIRGRDSHVEWILRLDRCDFRVSLLELARHKFHADHVRGEGLSMRLRQRVDEVTPATMAGLPPVPGFVDPPLADVGPPAAPLTDATYDLWSVELDDVIAGHVREVWLDTVRYSGDLDVSGRWVFRPLRGLEVGPATILARSLDVSFGMIEPWVSDASGRLELTVHPVDLESVDDKNMLRQVSIHGALKGTAQVSNLANRALHGRGSPVEVERAEAPFEFAAEVDQGVLNPGTRVRTESFEARAKVDQLLFQGVLELDLGVDGAQLGHALVHVASARIEGGGAERARISSLLCTLTTRSLDLTEHPFAAAAYGLEVDEAETHSLEYWRSRLPILPGIEVMSGTATASGRLEGWVEEKTGEGQLRFAAPGLAVGDGHTRVQGDVTGVVRIDGSLEKRSVRLSGSAISLRDVRASAKGGALQAPALDVRTAELAIDLRGATGRVTLEAPVVNIPSLAALGAGLSLPPDIVIEGGRGTAHVHLDVDVAELAAQGDIGVTVRDLRLRLGSRRLQGTLTLGLAARQNGPVTDLSGSQVAFQSTDAPGTPDWWGRVRLRQATLGTHPNFRFRTDVSAAFKDGSPWTALVADNTAIPAWLIDTVSTKGLEATGELVVTPSLLAARSVQAHAEGADVHFEFGKVHDERKEWAMLLELGAVMACVDVSNGHTQVTLLGARPRFRTRVSSLEAIERGSQ